MVFFPAVCRGDSVGWVLGGGSGLEWAWWRWSFCKEKCTQAQEKSSEDPPPPTPDVPPKFFVTGRREHFCGVSCFVQSFLRGTGSSQGPVGTGAEPRPPSEMKYSQTVSGALNLLLASSWGLLPGGCQDGRPAPCPSASEPSRQPGRGRASVNCGEQEAPVCSHVVAPCLQHRPRAGVLGGLGPRVLRQVLAAGVLMIGEAGQAALVAYSMPSVSQKVLDPAASRALWAGGGPMPAPWSEACCREPSRCWGCPAPCPGASARPPEFRTLSPSVGWPDVTPPPGRLGSRLGLGPDGGGQLSHVGSSRSGGCYGHGGSGEML